MTDTHRTHVLIIDDDALLRRALSRILRRHFEVSVADSASHALELLVPGCPYEYILCDLRMPGLGGREVEARVAQTAPDLVSRFMFMTGGATSLEDQDFLDARPGRVLHKPFGANELREAIEALRSR